MQSLAVGLPGVVEAPGLASRGRSFGAGVELGLGWGVAGRGGERLVGGWSWSGVELERRGWSGGLEWGGEGLVGVELERS